MISAAGLPSTSYVDRRGKNRRIRFSSSTRVICSSTTSPAKEDTTRVTRSKSVAATKPTIAAYATRSRTIKPAVAANPPTTTSSSSSSSTRVIATNSKTRAKENPTKRRSRTTAYVTRSRTIKPPVAGNPPPTTTSSSSSSSTRVIATKSKTRAKEDPTKRSRTVAYATRSRTIKPAFAANLPPTATPKVERRGRKRKIRTSSSSTRVICSSTTLPAKEDTARVTRSKSVAATKPTTAAYATRSKTIKPLVADVVLEIHGDVEPEVVQPPQNQTRGRKRNATAAPKLKKEKKSLKKAVGPEIPTQRLTTRSMAAAAAQGTTFFASLENPPPADLICPISSTVPQQPSPTDTNSSTVLDFSAVPQHPTMLNSATLPHQISTADIHSSTVPQPSMDDDVFYDVDDLFYATPPSSTTDYNSALVPSQPSMNNDDNLLHQSMLETPAENLVDEEFYQNDDQMEFVAGQVGQAHPDEVREKNLRHELEEKEREIRDRKREREGITGAIIPDKRQKIDTSFDADADADESAEDETLDDLDDDDDEASDDDDDYDYDYDTSDDESELMAELERIKKERAADEARKEDEEFRRKFMDKYIK